MEGLRTKLLYQGYKIQELIPNKLIELNDTLEKNSQELNELSIYIIALDLLNSGIADRIMKKVK